MTRIFMSYAREDRPRVEQISAALEAAGHVVWWDHQIKGGSFFAEEINRELQESDVVAVLWSQAALASNWVLDEAAEGRDLAKLVPIVIDGSRPPLGYRQYQTVDLSAWDGGSLPSLLLDSINRLTGSGQVVPPSAVFPKKRRTTICVLPFTNMSGDTEQEYFSDGITEDIITDLSKVSSLGVVARSTAFAFKGKAIDVVQACRQLGATHLLEGSVRKSGDRVRIAAQLIDGAEGDHCWAERWDRDLGDIFALQDEISLAVVAAVRLNLLPEEKLAIQQRGTTSTDAYNLYLMARQQYASGNQGDPRRDESIIRLCAKATELDSCYARAWALMALAQTSLHFRFGRSGSSGLDAAERAMNIEPGLADPHTVKARQLYELGRRDEAIAEVETALSLDPRSYEVNLGAGYLYFREQRFAEAIERYEIAAAAMESDYHSAGTLLSCMLAIGDNEGTLRAARMTLSRAELALAQDQNNGSAMGFAVVALAVLGETTRAREWIDRALLLDPENMNMRYNFACALCLHSNDNEGAMTLMESVLASTTATWLNHIKLDPDLALLREMPRFQRMLRTAERRLLLEGA
jgi:adenylate cyclase